MTSIHAYRIFTFAAVDLGLVVLASFAITGWLRHYQKRRVSTVTFTKTFIGLMLIGIITHFIIGQDTQLNYYLGLSKLPSNIT